MLDADEIYRLIDEDSDALVDHVLWLQFEYARQLAHLRHGISMREQRAVKAYEGNEKCDGLPPHLRWPS